MRAYVCDICKRVITERRSAELVTFAFECSNTDVHQVPTKKKIKQKLHLCYDCYHGFVRIAIEKAARQKEGAE